MMGRKPVVSMMLTVGVLTLALATGCGRRLEGNMVEPPETPATTEPTPAPVATPTPTPQPGNPGNPSGGGGTTVQGNLILGTPIVKGTGSALSLWTYRTVITTVDVINPASGALSGEVTCYFGAGTDAEDIQTKTVTVMPGQKQTLTFEKTGMFASAKARCDVKTHNTSGGMNSNGYPQYF